MTEAYDVIARRGGKWWIIDVPALESVTQARHVHEIEKQARGMVAAVLNLEESEVHLSVEVQLPEAIAEQWAEAESLLAQAGDVSRRAADLRRKVVRDLMEQEQLSQAETAVLLKLSPSRVQQLISSQDGANEARSIMQHLLDRGATVETIAERLNRPRRAVQKVLNGQTSGDAYVPMLRRLMSGV